MLLTIHGLPYSTKYQDLKQLIKDKCNISDFILDNLVSEGSNKKKVRIGLTDDGDGKLLIKCLDGIRLFGSLLQVVPVSKNQPNEAGTFDRQANTKASTFSNTPQYENNMQTNETRQWAGNPNQWQPSPVQVNPYNFDAHQSNIYPAQQGSIPARAEMAQLNQHQMDVFPSRSAMQQDLYKAPQPTMRTAVLREIQTVDTSPAQNIYQPPASQYIQNKPLIIKKDLFQGPQSNIDLRGNQMSGPKQNNTMSWLTPRQQSFPQSMRDIRGPNDRSGRYSPSDVPGSDGRRLPPPHRQNDDRHITPQGRKLSPRGRIISPSGLRISPQGRGISPQGRRISPQGRRISPQGRRISPQGRRISPQSRRISPQGRRISPQGRRVSPGPRIWPSRKNSPGRQVSPSRRHMQRGPERYSPTRRGVTDNPNPRPRFDQTRPAAPNQAIYADGFRGNVHENVQYPVPGARPQVASWQQFGNKPDEDRRLNFEPRATSPRKSRSPVRRGRSPMKDRFKRHSPSPRSPRRSWALEKRRSPEVNEAPPPPNWPGSKQDAYPLKKPDKAMWDRNKYDEMRTQDSESMRSNIRMPVSRAQSPPGREIYNPVEARYEASTQKVSNKHQLVDDSRRDFRQPQAMQGDDMKLRTDRPDVRNLHKDRLDFRQPTKPEQRNRDEEILQRRLETSKRRDREPPSYEGKKPLRVTETLDKELEDIYKRTAEFKKKAEEFRNAEERRKEEERRKNLEFQESLRHNMERDPPRDRSDLRREDRLPESRRFDIDDFQKKSLTRPPDRDMLRQVDQRRKPQFENKEGIGKDDLQSKSLDRHDDRREPRWADRRDERRDDRSYERPDVHRAERPNVHPNQRLDDHRTERRDDRRNERIDDRYSSRVEEQKKQDQKLSREKACSELAERILDRHENKTWKSDLRLQVKESLRCSLMNILNKMFRDKEASFIEYTVKFRAYYDENEQDKIFDEVMSSLNSHVNKRPAADVREIQSKSLRRDLEYTNVNEDKTFPLSRHKAEFTRKRPFSEPDKSRLPQKIPRTSAKDLHSKMVDDANIADEPIEFVDEKTIEKIEADAGNNAQSGLYALNPLLTRSLEAELQDVMIKVWQVFPDEAESDAEALVADKFRNQAGDDLSNMLGLNVTQRLLNIFNPLFVKLTFSSVPKQDIFKAFLKKYNIKSYKELDPKGLTYLAQARDITTFDSLCNGNQKASGNIKVTVQPCYRFSRCPANLECNFSNQVKPSSKTSKINEKISKVSIVKQKAMSIKNQNANKQDNTLQTKVQVNKTIKTKVNVKKPVPISKQSTEPLVTNLDETSVVLNKVSNLKKDTTPVKKAIEAKPAKVTPPKPEISAIKQEPKTPQGKGTVQKNEATVTTSKVEITSIKQSPKAPQNKALDSDTVQKTSETKPVNITPLKPEQDLVKTEPKTETKCAKIGNTVPVTKPANIVMNPNRETGNTTSNAVQTKTLIQTKTNPNVTSKGQTSTIDKKPLNAAPKPSTGNATIKVTEQIKSKVAPKAPTTPKPEGYPHTKMACKDKIPPTTNKKAVTTKTLSQNAKTNAPSKSSISDKPKVLKSQQSNIKLVTKTKFKTIDDVDDEFDVIEDDNEELNDEEILKMLGGGIVLDECIGSDVE